MKEEIFYGIEIAGVKVTSYNCNLITGKHIFGKKVSYDLKTNTLTLDNVEINGCIHFASNIKDITITLVGRNAVDVIGSVRDRKTINGVGSLKVRYISCYEQNCRIEDCSIDLYDTDLVMFGPSCPLTIRSANLSSEGMVAIGSFADIELVDCEIVEPINAQIIDIGVEDIFGERYRGKFICNENGNIAKKVVIKKK